MSRKKAILKTAARLFATQGFEGTTTVQLAAAAGVTEPLIFYHFQGKEDLFTRILADAFKQYFSRLDQLESIGATQFERIRNLIDMHFDYVDELPAETVLIISACPARFGDPEHLCTKNLVRLRERLTSYLRQCLEHGIQSGEFREVAVAETVQLLMGLLNGLMRQRALGLENLKNMRETTVDFCRLSLTGDADENRSAASAGSRVQ